jgi:hypothetical protein
MQTPNPQNQEIPNQHLQPITNTWFSHQGPLGAKKCLCIFYQIWSRNLTFEFLMQKNYVHTYQVVLGLHTWKLKKKQKMKKQETQLHCCNQGGTGKKECSFVVVCKKITFSKHEEFLALKR